MPRGLQNKGTTVLFDEKNSPIRVVGVDGQTIIELKGMKKIQVTKNGEKNYNVNASVSLCPTGIFKFTLFISIPKSSGIKIYRNSELSISIDGKNIESIEPIKKTIGEKWINLELITSNEEIKFMETANKQIKTAVFHLFEFDPLIGESFEIASGGWIVKGTPIPDKLDLLSTLSGKSWHTLSHCGEIKKPYGKEFTEKELKTCLQSLSAVFSFYKGAACKPAFVFGYDENNKIVWESSYSTPKPATSFKRWHGSKIGKKSRKDLFNGMMEKTAADEVEEKNWNSALNEAVNWYTIACSANSDRETKIALAQTAFERLSYELSVTDKGFIAEDGFNRLKAFDNLRMLFASLNIPVDRIYDALDIKQGEMEIKEPFDVPSVLTQARNSIMHPKLDTREKIEKFYDGISQVSVMYLELAILALCKYKGKYYNRLSGKMEEVPWTEQGKKDREKGRTLNK